jgi:ribonuclease HI
MSERLLAVWGARDFKDYEYVKRVLDQMQLGPDVTLVTAGKQPDAHGISTFASWYSERVLGKPAREHYPDYEKHPENRSRAREESIQKISASAHALLVFWDGLSVSTLKLLRERGHGQQPITVVYCPKDEHKFYLPETERKLLKYVQVWTDAGVSLKHSVQGYGYMIRSAGKTHEYSFAEWLEQVGSPRAELECVSRALQFFAPELRARLFVDLITDSEWTIMSLHALLGRPPLEGKAPYKNFQAESMKRLQPVVDLVRSCGLLRFQHVRGHRGHVENERCDQLAGQAIKELIAQLSASNPSGTATTEAT